MAKRLPPPASSEDGTILKGEHHVLELIATGARLHEVLDALCRVIDEQLGQKSSIFLLDSRGERLTLAAGPHLSDDWRALVGSFPITKTACGAAVARREQIVSPEISADPLYVGYHDGAKAAGFRAAWSTPFFSKDNRPLGTFAVCSSEPGGPDDAQRRFIYRASHLASIAVERHQTEGGLRESERRFSTAFYSSPACMTIARYADGRLLYVNDKFVTMFGYSRAEAIGQTTLSLGLWADPANRSDLWRSLSDRGGAREFEAKARTKAGEVLDLLMWTDRIQILNEECVLGIACDITDRRRAEKARSDSERLLRVVLDTLPVGVAVVNPAGDIALINPASQRIWGGLIPLGPERFARCKGWWHDTGRAVKPDEWASVRALASGERSINEVIEIEAFDGVRKIIQNSAVPIRDANERITGAVFVNEDISARKIAERELHDSLKEMHTLTGRLMRAQDEERRRIAQMLHETTAQELAALKMHLARLTRSGADLSEDDRVALVESIELAEQSMTDIRTLSYLLHPPLLDEAGLLSALRWYSAGFAERSGISVQLDLPATLERLPLDVETALFRIVQEALLNIHHHAASPNAVIRLRVDGPELTLDIEDRGRGMAPELIAQLTTKGNAVGVGIAGMRERLQQFGGTLDIQSNDRGTVVRARISLASAGS